jgi:hypothetical protein
MTYTSPQGYLFENEQLEAWYFIQNIGLPNENLTLSLPWAYFLSSSLPILLQIMPSDFLVLKTELAINCSLRYVRVTRARNTSL